MTNIDLAALLEECAVYAPPKMLPRVREAVTELRKPTPKPEEPAPERLETDAEREHREELWRRAAAQREHEAEMIACAKCKTVDYSQSKTAPDGYHTMLEHAAWVKPCKKHA